MTASKRRRQLLKVLSNGGRDLSAINSELGTTSSGILPQIRNLEEAGLIRRNTEGYKLTSFGWLVADKVAEFQGFLETAVRHREFWEGHDLGGIPEPFRKSIGQLGEGRLITAEGADVYRPITEFLQRLPESSWIKGVSPIFHPRYSEFFSKLMEEGIEISLILTEDVIEVLRKKHADALHEFVAGNATQIFVYEGSLGTAFTVSDCLISLGLYDESGNYDVHHDLIFEGNGAVRWGSDLFEYFKGHSKRLDKLL